MSTTTQTGVVKWFNDGKGFGFITPEDGSKDLFAHHSEIRNNGGFRTLAENQKVEYRTETKLFAIFSWIEFHFLS